ncbi:hypothetical protein [Nocardioides zhouii]|uniref:Uncharacterized protein n=1 Tax=Nocardioides zhouii TaxID=1168729 RepID=A0A4Q2SJU5_9ACTN|nr:hypothetical protein [Nocardioides zhouii]RYC05876.1 hypothetical protein EUA94_16610 [Nocardioides zhouii]
MSTTFRQALIPAPRAEITIRSTASRAARPPVWSVEWTSSERVFRVDGHEYRREQVALLQPRQRIVRSVLTSDYEVVEVLELVG